MTYDKNNPVSSIKHKDKRVSIPDVQHQGEEQMAVRGKPEKSEYQMFCGEFERGRYPELYWLDKYRNDDDETPENQLRLITDIRSLYKHEDVWPEGIIGKLYGPAEKGQYAHQLDLFGDNEDVEDDELERLAGYYQHPNNWQNRLILGDSLLVMNSLLNRESMAGAVQCIYFDPPYGISYNGNWQLKMNSTDVKDTDEGVTAEPEMIKAYRDTWLNGIHSYLSYLRDRLVMARELLSESGSCFVQISDSNVHLVRSVLDEVFGSENCVSQIIFTKTTGFTSNTIGNVCDYILWYARDINKVKSRKLYEDKDPLSDPHYNSLELEDGRRLTIKQWEKENGKKFVYNNKPKGCKVYRYGDMNSQGEAKDKQPYEFEGNVYYPSPGRHWTANYPNGLDRLKDSHRIYATKNKLSYIRYYEDFPKIEVTNLWTDILGIQSRKDPKIYVVQTSTKAVERCILMSTDPGDLVLDPTCGSGTTAYVSEQFGRRWITIDTSRVALNLAKKRLTTAIFKYYKTFDQSDTPDIRLGFIYEKAPHITLKSIANDLQPEEETLYDKPMQDMKRIRVSGPFSVETLQSLDVSSPDSLNDSQIGYDEYASFTDRIFNNLKSNGIRNGYKQQQAVMHTMEHVDEAYLNARGYYKGDDGAEHCVYFMIGPKFGTVSSHAVSEAIRAFREKHLSESKWLVVLGFSFEDTIESGEIKDYNFGNFQMWKVRMSDELLQDGLLKKDTNAGSFIIIGEPDIKLIDDGNGYSHVEILGMDMYDPIQEEVKARNIEDIAYWEMDDEYTGGLFKVRSLHFCGGKKNEFQNWRKGLDKLASSKAKKKAEQALRVEFKDEVWETLYGFKSEPIINRSGRRIAVRVVSQFGEESTKILVMP